MSRLLEKHYGDTPYRKHGPVTSRLAAESVKEVAPTIREKVFRVIEESGSRGVTNDELEMLTGLRIPTICGRVRELQLSGRIKDSGLRRETRSGRSAICWRVG